MYHAVVSDLDGTLLNAEHQLSPVTIDVLRTLSSQGRDLILASGRAYLDMAFLRERLGIDMYLIASNGAQIFAPDDELLYQKAIAPDLVRGMLDIAREHPVHINVYQNTAWLVEEAKPELLSYSPSGFAYEVQDLAAASVDELRGCIKLFFIAAPEQLLPLEQRLCEQFSDALEVTYSLPNCLEVMCAGVHKGTALTEVLSRLGHQPQQAMAFGDGLNDIEMLTLAGRGLVMGNASERVKAALPDFEIIDSHCQDGVARYLQRHLLS